MGNTDSVISISKKVLETSDIEKDSITLPKFSSILGSAYKAKGDLQNANKYHSMALEIAEKTNNEPLQ
jgi:hypothetical protein